MSSEQIKAPGRTAIWTEAALRALTGTAFIVHEDGEAGGKLLPLPGGAASLIALDAMAIADAFERACIARHEAEQEAARERVRAIGRFRPIGSTLTRTVQSVEGNLVTFAQMPGEVSQRFARVGDVLDPECYEAMPEDAQAATATDGKERA